jgi:hypothetical protein
MSDVVENCSICLGEFCNDSQNLSCGHRFHSECIEGFIESEKQRLEELYHDTDDELRPQLDLVIFK